MDNLTIIRFGVAAVLASLVQAAFDWGFERTKQESGGARFILLCVWVFLGLMIAAAFNLPTQEPDLREVVGGFFSALIAAILSGGLGFAVLHARRPYPIVTALVLILTIASAAVLDHLLRPSVRTLVFERFHWEVDPPAGNAAAMVSRRPATARPPLPPPPPPRNPYAALPSQPALLLPAPVCERGYFVYGGKGSNSARCLTESENPGSTAPTRSPVCLESLTAHRDHARLEMFLQSAFTPPNASWHLVDADGKRLRALSWAVEDVAGGSEGMEAFNVTKRVVVSFERGQPLGLAGATIVLASPDGHKTIAKPPAGERFFVGAAGELDPNSIPCGASSRT